VLARRTLFFAAVKALALRLLRSTTLTPCVFEGSYTNYPRVDICRETAFSRRSRPSMLRIQGVT